MNFYFLPNILTLRHAGVGNVLGGGIIMVCATDDDRTAVADYISDLAAELAVMAAWAEHTDLARLLEMTRLESEKLCGRNQSETAGSAPGETATPQAGRFESANVVLLSASRSAKK
jgi:hypothetical protein